jgi:molybdopterin-biosynthesis enzyme MoeA-like protein
MEEFEEARLTNKVAAFKACAASIRSAKDGKSAVINEEKESVCTWIGAPSPINPMVPGLPKNLRPMVLDTILDMMISEDAQIMLTQTIIKRDSLNESEAVDKTLDEIEKAKETQIQQGGRYSRRYDYAAEDVERYSRQSYDGDHKTFRHSLVARIDGATRKEVNTLTSMLNFNLNGQNILTEQPFGGHLRSIKAGLPTNEIIEETFTDVQGNTAAMLWPARNPIQLMSRKGVLLGFHSDARTPLFADFESDDFMSKHFAVFGGSGTGKTTTELYIDYNAAAVNCDYIHISPKEDMGTSHLNAIKALNGQLLKIGEGTEYDPNPWMVYFDPETMGESTAARRYAYRRTQVSLKKNIEFLIGSNFSTPMRSAFVATAKATYLKTGLVDKKGNPLNIHKWKDGKNWPSYGDWRKTCKEWLQDESKKSKWQSIQALLDNTEEMEEGNAWDWMDNHNTFDATGRFITIDVSGLEDGVKEAVTILLMDIINMRLKTPSPEAYRKKRRTILTLDEGAALLATPNQAKYIVKLIREARSGKMSVCFDNQDLDGAASILPVLKANTDFIILMCNMTKENVEEFGKEFYFTEKDKARLMEKGKGKYLLLRLGQKIPGEVVLTNKMKEIFFGETNQESRAGVCISDNYEIDSRVTWIRDKGLIASNWITKLDDYEIEGFTPTDATSVMGGSGKFPVWIADGLINENGLIDGETEDHWVTCYLAAGELCRAGYTDVKVNNWGGQKIEDIPDITCISPSGERIWIEYEHPGSHSIGKIETKKQKQEPYCDVWICLCQKANYPQVKAAVGKPFCIMRGVEFKRFIEKHGIKKHVDISGSSEQSGAFPASVQNDTVQEVSIDV